MIRGELQFTLSIAFRCVLHRNESLGIPCKNLVAVARSHSAADFPITKSYSTAVFFTSEKLI